MMEMDQITHVGHCGQCVVISVSMITLIVSKAILVGVSTLPQCGVSSAPPMVAAAPPTRLIRVTSHRVLHHPSTTVRRSLQ